MPPSMNIGEAARAAGVSPKMIRHYEQIGLMPEAARTEAGYRLYSERDVSVLRFIRQSRRLGFSMEQIAGLLGLWSDAGRASREVKALAQSHLADLEEKMQDMARMHEALRELVGHCPGDEHPDCSILRELSVESLSRPEPREIDVVKPTRRRRSPSLATPSAAAHTAASHADLMAWMHQGAAAAPRRSRISR